MRIIPDFNKYSEEWQYDNPANFNANILGTLIDIGKIGKLITINT